MGYVPRPCPIMVFLPVFGQTNSDPNGKGAFTYDVSKILANIEK